MSRMNGSQAIQAALDAAMAKCEDIVVIRVSGDENAQPQMTPRRLTLPLSTDAQLSFAAGCAAAGLRPVLDLTGVRDGARRLETAVSALPWASARRDLIFRLSDRYCPTLEGVRVVRPANSRESALAVRDALTGAGSVLILEDPLKAFEVCDVPGDIFDFDPSERAEEPAADEAAPSGPEIPKQPAPEEDIPPENPEETRAEAEPPAPQPAAGMGTRWRRYNGAELWRTASLLNVAPEEVARKCTSDLGVGVDVKLELDAQPGETAILPPDESDALLWVGRDTLSLCWRADRVTPAQAKDIITRAASALELPARLIMK